MSTRPLKFCRGREIEVGKTGHASPPFRRSLDSLTHPDSATPRWLFRLSRRRRDLLQPGVNGLSADVSPRPHRTDTAKQTTLDDRIAHPVLVEEVTSTGQVWVGASAVECCHPLVDRFLPQSNRFVGETRDDRVRAEIGEHHGDAI